jgi:ABC-type sugar transport system ATPase subunit
VRRQGEDRGEDPARRQCALGIGLPAARTGKHFEGLILDWGIDVRNNIALPEPASASPVKAACCLEGENEGKSRRQEATSEEVDDQGRVRLRHAGIVVHVSGGNQQKVVVAKCARLRDLPADDPRRADASGVDVGAKAAIYELHGRSRQARATPSS